MAGKKKGEKKNRKPRSDKGKPRKKGGGRRGSRKFKIPMPNLADLKAAGVLFAGDVIDKAVYALPEKLHPWAAAAFAGGLALKDADSIRMSYRIQLAHIARTTPSGNPALDRVADKIRNVLGSKSRGRDALPAGTSAPGGALTPDEQEAIKSAFYDGYYQPQK